MGSIEYKTRRLLNDTFRSVKHAVVPGAKAKYEEQQERRRREYEARAAESAAERARENSKKWDYCPQCQTQRRFDRNVRGAWDCSTCGY